MDNDKYEELLKKAPNQESRLLLGLILNNQINDFEQLRQCRQDMLWRHILESTSALDDLVKCNILKIVPSFRVNNDNKWKLYNKVVINEKD